MKSFELALAIIGTGLQASLCLLFLIKRSYAQFPIFFSFTLFSVVSALTGLAVQNVPSLYFDVYWTSEAFYVILAFFSLQEAVRSVFRNFHGMFWFRALFPTIGIAMIGIAIARTLLLPRAAHSVLTVTLFTLEIGVGLLQFAIFAVFVLLIQFFHMRWRQHAFGIVLGFGIASAGTLVAYLLRSEFGTKLDPVVRLAPPMAYIIGVAIWLATFLKAESGQPEAAWAAALTPEQMIVELRRHTKAVKGILGR
ncbi:MAG TPA: hypothetical protein VGK24_10430 [Candidatus Angelobacter sp.]|jgi:hypothetical protein